MTPADRIVATERALSENGMVARQPSHDGPDLPSDAHVWLLFDDLTLSPAWHWPDVVEWWRVIGYRAESHQGLPREEINYDDYDY